MGGEQPSDAKKIGNGGVGRPKIFVKDDPSRVLQNPVITSPYEELHKNRWEKLVFFVPKGILSLFYPHFTPKIANIFDVENFLKEGDSKKKIREKMSFE